MLINSTIKLNKYNNVKPQHLHDDRHFERNRNQDAGMSKVQMFSKNIYEVTTQKLIDIQKIRNFQRYPNKNFHNKGTQSKSYQRKNTSSYFQHQQLHHLQQNTLKGRYTYPKNTNDSLHYNNTNNVYDHVPP